MPRSAEQFGKIREQRRRQILDVALTLFSSEGFERTSIAQIARKANISKGLIYNYFTSKEAMLEAIVIRSGSEIASLFDPNHDGRLSRDELHYLIDAILGNVEANLPFYRLLTKLMLQPQILEKHISDLNKIGGPLLKMLSDYFEQEGHPDPTGQAYLFSAMLNGIAMHYIQNPEQFPMNRVRQAAHQLF